MQDFYIQQRTAKILNSEEIQRWFLTVVMLAPEGVVTQDDESSNFLLATQEDDYLYIMPLTRHLTVQEAERIVEGYMRVTEHDFEIETSNVYRADADFGHPFENEVIMDEGARDILEKSYARQAHNEWIQEMMSKGYRYGLNMSESQKTHPAMRPYDDLPTNYRNVPKINDKKLLDYYSLNISKFS